MASGFSRYLRSDSIELQLGDALRQPTTRLLGVSEAAATALEEIGIFTIFDLGAASLFTTARAVAGAGGPGELAAHFGMAPGDWLKPGTSFGALDAIGGLPLESLRGLTDAQTQNLKAALDVATIEEFANWPPQRLAREMLGETVGSALTPDEIQTEALRPRFGEYPTERVYYTSLVMLDSGRGEAGLVDLDGPLSLADAMSAATGFNKPAIGALVTFSQSWYAQGITLGQMLHSLALAPGEATRIAVIDFARTVAARASEAVSESEALASQSVHQRALSEVQSSVARDMQSGGSTSHVHSESDSGGFGLGISAIVPVGGALLGGAFGGSYQGAATTTDANSSSWSLGKRSVTASMTQNVNDRTEQHSTQVRNRRATAVREVSETEHQQVSTRIVANYNHMHALTVQYYEVVQIYRVQAEVHAAERVLLLPIELTDFASDEMMEAFRGVLARAALTTRARDLLLDPTSTVEIRPAKSFHSALVDAALQPMLLGSMMRMAAPATAVTAASVATTEIPPPAAANVTSISVSSFLAGDDAVVRGSAIVMRPIIRPRSSSLFYPDEVELVAVQLEGIPASNVTLSMTGGGRSALTLQANDPVMELPSPVPIGDLADISVQKPTGAAARGLARLHLSYRGRRFTSPAIPVALPASAAGTSLAVVRISTDCVDRKAELKAHLAANRAHYSAQVFRSLGSAAVVGLLSKFRWNGRPLIEQVEPKVLSVAGNFIVLRAPVEPEEASGVLDGPGSAQTWSELLEDRRLSPRSVKDQRVVPIPTDGVFAEAVLGRSNSAEKLDITRFWNWQDSPAPLTPPELGPVSSESRARGETISPSQLGPATLNIVNPTNLPDPSGLGASLGALAAMNFRDMSGLAGTQGLAGTATTGTLTATTEAGRNATAMAGVAADVLKTAITAGYGRQKEGGVSAEGARVNHGRDMDRRAVGGGPAEVEDTDSRPTGGLEDETSESAGRPGTTGQGRSREGEAFDQGAQGFSPDALGGLAAKVTRAALDLPPEDEGSGLEGSGGSGNFGQDEDPELAELIDIDLGEGRNQLSGLDHLFRGARGDVLRARVSTVAAEFEVDPEFLAMNVVTEKDDIRVWLSQGEVLNTVIGLDFWHEERPRIFAAMPAGADPIPSRELAAGFTNEVGNPTGPRHAFPNSLQALRALAARLRFTEQELEAELGAATYASLGGIEQHFLVRLWFNSGHNSLGSRQAIASVRAGRDPIIRERSRVERTGVGKLGPQRAASIRAVQAAHLRRQFFDTEFI